MAPPQATGGTSTPTNSDDEKHGPSTQLVTPDTSISDGGWVKEPSPNDVLCGRGGSINSHPGNERFRNLVEKRKRIYLTARFKREKRLIASSIVNEIRALNPPGRFLSREAKSGKWKDIGDEKARDKTSQALRENAPSIRAEIETEINEQRAEMQRAEDAEASVVRSSHHPGPPTSHAQHHHHPPHHPTSQPPPPPHYHHGYGAPSGAGGWGYHPAYYGSYPTHMPPPSGHPHGYPPPPHSASPYPPPPHHYGTTPDHHYSNGYSQPPPPRPHPPKSALEQTADSVREFFGGSVGGNVPMTQSGDDSRSGSINSAASSKPIVYVHERKRRSVKFATAGPPHRDNSPRRSGNRRSRTHSHSGISSSGSHGGSGIRPPYSPVRSSGDSMAATANSLMDVENSGEPEHVDLEPQSLNDTSAEPHSAFSRLLSNMPSFDASTIVCGLDSSDDRIPFPRSSGRRDDRHHHPHPDYTHHPQEEDMTVEWEGQEVQLVDHGQQESYDEPRVCPDDQALMPPPEARRPAYPDAASSIGFSSIGSCHSWLPDQLVGSAASFFTGSTGQRVGVGGGGISPSGSMDMDYSGGRPGDHYSMGAGSSIGGGSLTRVFEDQALQDTNNSTNRSLQQIPSWERSLRSRSPVSLGSVGSDEDEDASLISKTSSKSGYVAGGPGNGGGGMAAAPRPSTDMMCE